MLLTMARRQVEREACPCGCGLRAVDALDDAKAARMQVTYEECHARTAMEEWRAEHAESLPRGALVGVYVLPEGEEPVDPMKKAGEDAHAALLARFPHLRVVKESS